jgi:hypothetical protein
MLIQDVLEFDGAPPTRDEVEARLREQGISAYGFDSYEVTVNRARIGCMVDVVTRPYVLAFLLERGGRSVHYKTGAVQNLRLPAFTSRAWRDHSWWFRLYAHLRFNIGCFVPGVGTWSLMPRVEEP